MALRLEGSVGLDGSGFEAGLNRLQKSGEKFAARFAGDISGAIGQAFAVGAVLAFTKSMVDLGSHINDTATRLGASKTAAQEFSYAAQQSGGELEQFASGMDRLNKAMESVREGGEGSAKAAAAFQRLGISLETILNPSTQAEDVMKMLGARLENMNVTGRTSTDMLEIFGKSGTKLIPILKELRENIEKFHAKGLGLTDSEIADLDKAGDTMATLSLQAKVLGARTLVGAAGIANGDFSMGPVADVLIPGVSDLNFDASAARGRITSMQAQLAEQARMRDVMNPTAPAGDVESEKASAARAWRQEQDDILKIEERTAQLTEQNRIKEIGDENRLRELIEERAKALAQVERAKKSAQGMDLRDYQAEEMAAKDKKEIDEIQSRLANKGKPKSPRETSSDSLVRVGNFLGSSQSVISKIGERTNQLLYSIDQRLAALKPSTTDPLGVPST